MPSRTPVSFAASAVTDLEDIKAYYVSEGDPENGGRIIAELIAAIERVADFPLSGRIVPEFEIEYLRETVHPPFRIVYRCDRKKVRIVRVWRSERLLKRPEE